MISAKLKQNLIKYLNDNYHLPVLFEVYLTVSFHFPVKERRRSVIPLNSDDKEREVGDFFIVP